MNEKTKRNITSIFYSLMVGGIFGISILVSTVFETAGILLFIWGIFLIIEYYFVIVPNWKKEDNKKELEKILKKW